MRNLAARMERFEHRVLWPALDRSLDGHGFRASFFSRAIVASEWIREHVASWFCDHRVIDDQCGRPEHRFCIRCGAPQPGADVNA